jgi:hypothetical protein
MKRGECIWLYDGRVVIRCHERGSYTIDGSGLTCPKGYPNGPKFATSEKEALRLGRVAFKATHTREARENMVLHLRSIGATQ